MARHRSHGVAFRRQVAQGYPTAFDTFADVAVELPRLIDEAYDTKGPHPARR